MNTGTIRYQVTAADLAHRITSITRAENAGWVDTRVCTLSGLGFMRAAIEAPAVPLDEQSTDEASVYLPLSMYRNVVAASERARDWICELSTEASV